MHRIGLRVCGVAFAFFALGAISASAQFPSSQSTDCSDPSVNCQSQPQNQSLPPTIAPQQQRSTENPGTSGRDVYVDSAGLPDVNGSQQRDQLQQRRRLERPEPPTDLQRLAKQATGELLPIFGRELFKAPPSTFAPADQIPASPDYILGPGDEVMLRIWGHDNLNSRLTVDRSGSIYVPQVGAVAVAGLRFGDLQAHLKQELSRTYRNFDLSVNLGKLRSIQVFVLGEAYSPGSYTVSSLSTIFNALIASGGPTPQGSLRNVQLRRGSQTVATLDLYDLVIKGDRSKDTVLQSGDVIFIPFVGAQVAIGGSVRHPAIYELHDGTTVGDLLQLAGGLTPTGSPTQLSLERVGDDHTRAAMSVNFDAPGRAMALHDGDVLYVNHIAAAYQQSVTIRGNLANPGRFPWHSGMRLSDIIPDRMSLLTTNYWQQRNRLGVPTPLFEPLPRTLPYPWQREQGSYPGQNSTSPSSSYPGSYPGNGRVNQSGQPPFPTSSDDAGRDEVANALGTSTAQDPGNGYQEPNSNANARNSRTDADTELDNRVASSDRMISRGSLAEEQQSVGGPSVASVGQRNTIKIPAPEIDWSYAVIERLNPDTLKSSLVPFNLQKLIQDHDPAQNLELQPGDTVTILSQADIHVPQDEQTKYVRLEGEFGGAGVYSVGPNETLDELVRRAGGLSSKAYLYGANFTRESARVFQQQRLDEYVSSLAISMQRSAAVRSASAGTAVPDPNALYEQRDIVAQLRKLRATGRVVLEFQPNSSGTESIPAIPLEDGDVFRVPSRPLTVSVIGAVYGQNVFLYNPKRKVEDYVLLAGKPNPIADRRHAFIIRADGSVYSRERAKGAWKNSFDETQINPGDSIVIPEKSIQPTLMKQIIDYSQIFSQFALGAAAVTVIRQ